MKLRSISQILTLVLVFFVSFSHASPTSTPEGLPKAQDESESGASDKDLVKESGLINVIPDPVDPKKLPTSSPEFRHQYYHHYQSSLSPRLGLIMDFKNLPDLATDVTVGLSYAFAERYSPRWEIGFDFSLGSKLYLHGVRKWTMYEKEAFRPFYKLGLMHNLVAKEELASISNFKNYMLYGSIGLEDLLEPPTSVRLELEVSIGMNEYLFLLVLGGSFGL